MATRRQLIRLLGCAAPAALLSSLLRRDAFAAPARIEARRFLAGVDEASAALAARKLRPLQWQERVEELGRALDLRDLLRAADFDSVARSMVLPDVEATSVPVRIGERRLSFATKIFGIDRGCAITPHGHRNMVSMHLVLKGEVRARHFDRVRDEREAAAGLRNGLSKPGGHLVLRPTIDKVFRAGDASSISSDRDNVHWLASQGGPAWTFDCIVSDLEPLGYGFGIDLVDPSSAERLADGTLRARVISWDESLRKYGKTG